MPLAGRPQYSGGGRTPYEPGGSQYDPSKYMPDGGPSGPPPAPQYSGAGVLGGAAGAAMGQGMPPWVQAALREHAIRQANTPGAAAGAGLGAGYAGSGQAGKQMPPGQSIWERLGALAPGAALGPSLAANHPDAVRGALTNPAISPAGWAINQINPWR